MLKSDQTANVYGIRETEAVAVDIYDQTYSLRGSEPAYIDSLAALVDGKMRAIAVRGETVDSLRVAVLASLNIADELTRLRRRYEDLANMFVAAESSMRNRSAWLAGMLDEVLDVEYGCAVRQQADPADAGVDEGEEGQVADSRLAFTV